MFIKDKDFIHFIFVTVFYIIRKYLALFGILLVYSTFLDYSIVKEMCDAYKSICLGDIKTDALLPQLVLTKRN